MADPHAPQHHESDKKSPTALVSNALAIAGFVVLAIIIVWGLLHIASLSSGWFGNLFNNSNTRGTILVSAPESAISGRPARIAWQHASEGGRYAFLYECRTGLDVGIPIVKDGETVPTLARVPCGTAFTLGNATSSLIVVPILTASSTIPANINIVYVPEGRGAEASGSATIAVTTASGAPEVPKTPAAPNTRTTGAADLAVSIVSLTTDGSGMTTAVFTISNIGGSATGVYAFTAALPTAQPYAFHSDAQASLAPGDSIVNTLRFTQTIPGIFSVAVDPSNMVAESNESNNATSREMYR